LDLGHHVARERRPRLRRWETIVGRELAQFGTIRQPRESVGFEF
jgi:hypothetical protein